MSHPATPHRRIPVDRPLSSFARLLAPASVGSGLLLMWALAAQSLLALPLSLTFVALAFLWGLSRPDPARPFAAATGGGAGGFCGGCATGCVECRERIDVGEAA
jgi:hypothetical protein